MQCSIAVGKPFEISTSDQSDRVEREINLFSAKVCHEVLSGFIFSSLSLNLLDFFYSVEASHVMP